jgi:hypothetical protein
MKPRQLIIINEIIASFILSVLFIFSSETSVGQTSDPLLFLKDSFKLETKTVKTSFGEKIVTYRSYMHIPYVANPVDRNYESMNVSVPIKINDVTVDATNAPILFVIGVGGYMSVNNMRGGNMGSGRGGPGGPGGQTGRTPNMGRVAQGGASGISGNSDLALAAGYVVVSPGCRGRDNKATDGTYYGKAPAAIVDLKAAVRYIRHNKNIIPGNVNWIFSTGVSAGGALSALLGASGNSHLYDSYFKEIGAAQADDNIYGSACFCPIMDLEHADGAYEWMYGAFPTGSGLVDQELSKQLRESYAKYQASLNLQGKNSFGPISADNYDRYLLKYYLIPSAEKFFKNLTEEKRNEYLSSNKWISWSEKGAKFSFADYVSHVGRMKGLPAFDDFNMKQPENGEFGNKTTDSRHFTNFSLQHTSGNKSAMIDDEMISLVNMMNGMYFIGQDNKGCAQFWWLRKGTSDPHTSQTVIINLATSLENRKKDVNALLYWDAGHGADQDPEEFIAWIGKTTGFSRQKEKPE